MATSIALLANSANQILKRGDAIYREDAARKAVRGQGIFNKGEIDKLVPQVLSLMGRVAAQVKHEKAETKKYVATVRRWGNN